uniref:MICOS complex subunit MIC13 n=1 Tax=Phallusia mammillata TaxID=59560 RepID=A0A6F9DIY4_9ASCI|nr:uncharacterized protein LOC101242704 [Phallusia mammillata]
MSSAIASAAKFSGKVGIFGGAVYLTTRNGLWGDDTDQSLTAIKNITENVDNRLGGNYLTKVGLPTNTNLGEKWNYGVDKSINFLADAPDNLTNQCKKCYQYLSDKAK